MCESHDKFWFPAKKYGYGWGLPCTWQGWAVLVVYGVFLIAGRYVLKAYGSTSYFILYFCILSVLLIGIVILKGEKPRWRWGDKANKSDTPTPGNQAH